MSSVLADARAYLGRTLEEVQRALGPHAEPIPGDEYGAMGEVTSIEYDVVFPGTLFLRDDTVELIYLGEDAVAGLSRADLAAELGGEAVRLRSRAGKQAGLFVHAEQGVAYSAQGDSLDFVEVFRPRSQSAYETEIYREPHAFIR